MPTLPRRKKVARITQPSQNTPLKYKSEIISKCAPENKHLVRLKHRTQTKMKFHFLFFPFSFLFFFFSIFSIIITSAIFPFPGTTIISYLHIFQYSTFIWPPQDFSLAFSLYPTSFINNFLITSSSTIHYRYNNTYPTELPTVGTIFPTLSHPDNQEILPINVNDIFNISQWLWVLFFHIITLRAPTINFRDRSDYNCYNYILITLYRRIINNRL